MGVTAGLHAEAGMRTVLTSSQVFVKGEFIGGCDIVREMYQSGELQDLFQNHGVAFKAE